MSQSRRSFDRVPCPLCGHVFDLEQAWDDADGRRFVELLTQLPAPAVRPFYNYLKLFKPAHQSLRWNKVLKLAQELAPMIHAAKITRNGIDYVVPVAHWVQVMDDLVRNRPKGLALPLKGHGYLLSILANQADKQAAIQEAEREQQKRNRGRSGADTGPVSVAEIVKPKPKAAPKKPKSKPPADWKGTVK